MKYVVILGDGMSDLPVPELGGKTPLMCAKKPNIDTLVRFSELGLAKTVPDSLSPGSDTANLSAMGYDPEVYYSGRSPLEAVSMGINLKDTDTTFRCNLVNLSDEQNYEDKIMMDYSADEISTEEAEKLIKYAASVFNNDFLKLYNGISYRHCLVWSGLENVFDLTPPHDISDKKIGEYLPVGDGSEILKDIMKKSYDVLKNHSVNIERVKRGLKPANSLWFWGQGKKPALKPFKELYGLKGAVISAVDLIKGIAICAGMKSIDVEGATGNLKTNFKGKADAALNILSQGYDFVYIHIEAPDECGHRHEIEGKVHAIELIDSLIVKTVVEGLRAKNEPFTILIMPDHPTPLTTKTHSRDPVPYLLYRSDKQYNSESDSYDENTAKQSGNNIDKGCNMIKRMINFTGTNGL